MQQNATLSDTLKANVNRTDKTQLSVFIILLFSIFILSPSPNNTWFVNLDTKNKFCYFHKIPNHPKNNQRKEMLGYTNIWECRFHLMYLLGCSDILFSPRAYRQPKVGVFWWWEQNWSKFKFKELLSVQTDWSVAQYEQGCITTGMWCTQQGSLLFSTLSRFWCRYRFSIRSRISSRFFRTSCRGNHFWRWRGRSKCTTGSWK